MLAMVDAIAEAGVTLPGVSGDAATAARFAGQWSERCKSAVKPFQGLRLYELLAVGRVPVRKVTCGRHARKTAV